MSGEPHHRRRRLWRAFEPVWALLGAAISAVAAVAAFWLGADIQLFGGLSALSLLLAGLGLAWWADWGMPDELVTEPREELASTPQDRAEFAATFARGGQAISRRRVLAASVITLIGAYFALAVSMVRSLAPNPYSILDHTAWKSGARVVTTGGDPLKPADVRIDSVLTVFPDGHVGEADAQTLLIRVRPDLLQLPSDRQSWATDGIVAYSKVCTHAGCPVGLYQAEQHLLLCPCHESTFDVLRGAQPIAGPAARALPQLPLTVDGEGFLVAQADYSTQVGPSFWDMPTGGS
jgi:quinol---cytochrome c reductase iron-sulfur subunit